MELIPGLAPVHDPNPATGRTPPPQGPEGRAFEEYLEDTLREPGAPRPDAPPAGVASFNAANLLSGQYPPPDSGAGFLYIELTLLAEARA